MNKIAFIIPGYGHSSKTRGYSEIAKIFKQDGIKPVIINIKWSRRTLTDHIKQFLKQAEKYDLEKVYCLGFSFGAMISFAISNKIKPELQILCSLSPYFREDLPHLKKSWLNYFGKKSIAELKKYSAKEIAKNTPCKTILLAGTREGKEIEKRAKEVHKIIKNSKLVFVEGSKHDIANKNYFAEIRKIISAL